MNGAISKQEQKLTETYLNDNHYIQLLNRNICLASTDLHFQRLFSDWIFEIYITLFLSVNDVLIFAAMIGPTDWERAFLFCSLVCNNIKK